MTKEEFLSKIKDFYKGCSTETICRDLEEGVGAYTDLDQEKFTEEFGAYHEVASYGGEGRGEDYWSVLYFPKVDKYLKLSGYWQSHEGSTWERFYVVEAKQKTITVYE
jgi:hypothetical protein